MIKIVAASKIVQAGPDTAPSDVGVLWDGDGTDAERVIEFAGRVCYHSTHRFGAAPAFIQQRVAEGHADIIEHGWVSLVVDGGAVEPLGWVHLNRYIEVTRIATDRYLVSGNLRAWRDLLSGGTGVEVAGALAKVSPKIFKPLEDRYRHRQLEVAVNLGIPAVVAPTSRTAGQATVTPLLINLPDRPHGLGDWDMLGHSSATFLVEGVSRSLSHQFVRHRSGSFSQSSQRYIELSKGGWGAIIPPSIANNPEAKVELDEFWAIAEEKYQRLRDLGIRKEDARSILPNATETRFVVTMSFAGWYHFCLLRAVDRAAQWEIRAVGMAILEYLGGLSPVFARMLVDYWMSLKTGGTAG